MAGDIDPEPRTAGSSADNSRYHPAMNATTKAEVRFRRPAISREWNRRWRMWLAGLLRSAARRLHPETAPGPDGMTALFYQKFWDIVKDDLTHMVNQFLSEGSMASRLNDTNICLIPKITKPTETLSSVPLVCVMSAT